MLNTPCTPPSSDDSVRLDVRGILCGVDKASLRGEILCSWDYLRHYAEAFRSYRDEPINFLEIGVSSGASLKMWLGYFSKATIIGVDIEPKCAALAAGRVQIRIGSQSDAAFMTDIAATHPLSVIIDDGSHMALDIIRSFEILFPLLLPGGTYVIEDLAFHFAKSSTEGGTVEPHPLVQNDLAFPYFAKLITAKAAHVTTLKDASEALNQMYRSVDSISVVGGALIIKKKAVRNLSEYVAAFEEELRTSSTQDQIPYSYVAVRYAEFLMTYEYKVDRAVQLLEEIIAREPGNWLAHKLLHKALLQLGRPEAASAVQAHLLAHDQDVTLPGVYLREWMVYPH